MNDISLEESRHLPAQSSSSLSSSFAAVDHAIDRSLILGHTPGSNMEEGMISEEEIRQAKGAGRGSILEAGQGLGPPRDLEQGQGLDDVHQLPTIDLELRASEDEGETFLEVHNSNLNLHKRSSYMNGTCCCCCCTIPMRLKNYLTQHYPPLSLLY